MNHTTIAPSTFRAVSPNLARKTTFFMAILRFSLISWLAEQSAFLSLANWCSEFLNIKVTPREAVALVHTEIAIIAAILPIDVPTLYHLLAGVWVAYAAQPLVSLCRRFIRDWGQLLFNT